MIKLPAFPHLPQHVMRVELAGRRYIYRRTWRPRLNAWYVDIYDGDDNPILLGRRLVAQSTLSGELPLDLPGEIFVRGQDDYRRQDLGQSLREIFISHEELAAFDEPGPDDFIVAIEDIGEPIP